MLPRVKSQKLKLLRIFKTKGTTGLETCKKTVFSSHLQPGGDIKSDDLAIFDFRIL